MAFFSLTYFAIQSSLKMNTTYFWPTKNHEETAPAYRISTMLGSLLVVATALGDYLFWHEQAGLNVLVYMIFMVVAHLVLLPSYAPVRRTTGFWVAVVGCLASGGLVAWYGSNAAEWAALASGLLLVGLVNQPALRLVSSAVGTGLVGMLPAVTLVVSSLRAPKGLDGKLRRGWFYGRVLGVEESGSYSCSGVFNLGTFNYRHYEWSKLVYEEVHGHPYEEPEDDEEAA